MLHLEEVSDRAWIVLAPHVNPLLFGAIQAVAAEKAVRATDVHQVMTAEEATELIVAYERLYDWTMIVGWQQDGWTHGMLVRCSIEQEPEHAYYWFHARVAKATLGTLVCVAGQRWQIEQAFQAAKGECGLDHYEVRNWHGWCRHITLAMLAFAALVTFRSRGEKTPVGQVPLSVPELRHLLTHLFWRGWHGVEHLLRWSSWRRKHQFHALRYHYQKRGSPLPILYLQL